jgi:hypothetical protein
MKWCGRCWREVRPGAEGGEMVLPGDVPAMGRCLCPEKCRRWGGEAGAEDGDVSLEWVSVYEAGRHVGLVTCGGSPCGGCAVRQVAVSVPRMVGGVDDGGWHDERRAGGAGGSSCGEPARLPERLTKRSARRWVSRLEGSDYGVTILMSPLSAAVPEPANSVTAAVAGPACQPGKGLVLTVTPSRRCWPSHVTEAEPNPVTDVNGCDWLADAKTLPVPPKHR